MNIGPESENTFSIRDLLKILVLILSNIIIIIIIIKSLFNVGHIYIYS